MVGLILVGAALTGCTSTDATGDRASGPEAAAPTTPPAPSSPTPSSSDAGGGGGGGGGTGGGSSPNPGDPPKTPSDTTQTSFVTGTVVAGGSGPCYGLETDDGKRYALYGGGGSLSVGQRIRVEFAPQTQAVSCGPGQLIHIVRVSSPGQ
jgi:hypothetical protein